MKIKSIIRLSAIALGFILSVTMSTAASAAMQSPGISMGEQTYIVPSSSPVNFGTIRFYGCKVVAPNTAARSVRISSYASKAFTIDGFTSGSGYTGLYVMKNSSVVVRDANLKAQALGSNKWWAGVVQGVTYNAPVAAVDRNQPPTVLNDSALVNAYWAGKMGVNSTNSSSQASFKPVIRTVGSLPTCL